MFNLNSNFFFNNIVGIEQFIKLVNINNVQKFKVIKKISLVIILPNIKNLEDISILNSLVLLKFLSKSTPTIKKLYLTKSKTYFVILKVSLHKNFFYSFFSYFLQSYLKLSNSDKKISIDFFLNEFFSTSTFYIKNIQMFSEIAEHFLTWRHGLYINIFFVNSKLNIIKFLKSFGFFN